MFLVVITMLLPLSFLVGVSEICPFPMYHSAGLFSGIYAGIPLGGTFIFLEHHQVELLLKTIQTYKVAQLWHRNTYKVTMATIQTNKVIMTTIIHIR